MKIENKSRVILLGFDGAVLKMVDRFRNDLPNFNKLLTNGSSMEALPCPGVDTGTNWKVISSGSTPSVNGIYGFHVHIPGQSFENMTYTFNSDLCKAEYLWDQAQRQGKKCILINVPCAIPFKTQNQIIVGGDGVISNRYYIAPMAKIDTTEQNSMLKTASGWSNLPQADQPSLEFEIPISGGVFAQTARGLEKVEKSPAVVNLGGEIPPQLHLTKVEKWFGLVYPSSDKGYDRIRICSGKDFNDSIVELENGQVSDALTEEFLTVSGKIKADFWIDVHSIDKITGNFVLLRSAIQARTGWAYPESLQDKISDRIGAWISFSEATGHLIDVDKNSQTALRFGKWMYNCSELLMEEYSDWDFLFAQIHLPDSHNHALQSYIWPECEHYKGDKSSAWDQMKKAYVVMDEILGDFLDLAEKNNSSIAVVSDHGGLPQYKFLWIGGVLQRAGLMKYIYNSQTGCYHTDWSASKACPFYLSEHIFVNLRGRDPEGIVEPGQQYESVRDEIISALLAYRDPDTNECPFSLVSRRESLKQFKISGERVGDVVYFLRPGYVSPLIQQNIIAKSFYDKLNQNICCKKKPGGSHSFLPDAETSTSSNSAMFLAADPKIKKDYRRHKPIDLQDVAVIISKLMQMHPPQQANGKLPYDIFCA